MKLNLQRNECEQPQFKSLCQFVSLCAVTSLIYFISFGAHALESVRHVADIVSGINSPIALARDSSGDVYVLEEKLQQVARYSPSGVLKLRFGGKGKENGKFTKAVDIDVDVNGIVYVLDSGKKQVHVFNTEGEYLEHFGSSGTAPGQFKKPVSIAVDHFQDVYVADAALRTVSKYSRDGIYLAGMKWTEAIPKAIAVDRAAVISVILDKTKEPLQRLDYKYFKPKVIRLTDSLSLERVSRFCIDDAGTFYFIETRENRIHKFNVDTGMRMVSFGSRGAGRGQFNKPKDIACHGSEPVIIADQGNKRLQSLKVGNKGAAIKYLSKSLPGVDVLLPVRLSTELGMVELHDGVLYYLVPSLGRIVARGKETRAFGSKGKGTGQLKNPRGFAVGGNGTLYVADTDNNRIQIFSKDGSYSFGSRGKEPGQFNKPSAIALSKDNNLYIADTKNDRIQVFTNQGILITTFGQPAKKRKSPGAGEIDAPISVVVDSKNRVIVLSGDTGRLHIFDEQGRPQSAISTTQLLSEIRPVFVTVDENDVIYLLDANDQAVLVLSPELKLQMRFGARVAGSGSLSDARGISVRNGVAMIADGSTGTLKRYRLHINGRVFEERISHVERYFVTPGGDPEAFRDLAMKRAVDALGVQLGISSVKIQNISRVERDLLDGSGEGRLVISVPATLEQSQAQLQEPSAVSPGDDDEEEFILK